jgi:hypothetical protein
LQTVNEIDTFGLFSLFGEPFKWKDSGVGLCCPWIYSREMFQREFEFPCCQKMLTPILRTTTYDAMLTTMINFQDVLKQKGDSDGGLWADESVYRIAKEIQLLKPEQFSSMFPGLGGFPMGNIALACLNWWVLFGTIRDFFLF